MSSSEDPPSAEASVPLAEPTAERVRLKISAASPYTEIRVLDATFEPLALTANSGSLEIDVTPGLYEVGFRVEEEWESQHVIAEPGAGEIVVEQSAAAARGAQDDAALETLACEQHEPGPRGDGATVIVVLRPADDAESPLAGWDSITVTLLDAADTAEVAADLSPDLPWTWRFSVAPGFWRLRINEAHPRQPFEMPITVIPDYVLHVSAPLRPVGEGPCVDLERFRMRLLRPDDQSAMDDMLIGFEEAALAALGSGRSLFGPDIENLIADLAGDKALNPMLGIFAAHLCEHGRDGHIAFRERLLERLTDLTGGRAFAQPDVEILRLAFMMRRGQPIDAEPPILFPPMLAASWRLLLEVAGVQPSLIPSGSLCERVADRLWSSSLWTAWTAPPLVEAAIPTTRSAVEPELETLTVPEDLAVSGEKIAALLDHVELRQWFREASTSMTELPEGLAWHSEAAVTPAEAAIAFVLYPVADDEERQSRFSRLAQHHERSFASAEKADPGTMAARLGLPQATVERALSSLAEKLDAMASSFNIKL